MAAGYLLVWIAFSVGAAFLQRGFSALLLLSTMMKATSPLLSGGLLVAAGIYQFTPLKYQMPGRVQLSDRVPDAPVA